MKATVKKIVKIILRIIVISTDVILVPCLVFCRWLSAQMLLTESECLFLRFNGQCLSCGGTHFVSDLLSGRIFDAFMDNQFFFICTFYLFVTLIALNLWLIFNVRFAKKVLKYMYSIPALISFVLLLILFLIVRNIPMMLYFGELAFKKGWEIAPDMVENNCENVLNHPTIKELDGLFFPFFSIWGN